MDRNDRRHLPKLHELIKRGEEHAINGGPDHVDIGGLGVIHEKEDHQEFMKEAPDSLTLDEESGMRIRYIYPLCFLDDECTRESPMILTLTQLKQLLAYMFRVVTKVDHFTTEVIAKHNGMYEYRAYTGSGHVVLEILCNRLELAADRIHIPNRVAFEMCRDFCGAGKELKAYLDQFVLIDVDVFGHLKRPSKVK